MNLTVNQIRFLLAFLSLTIMGEDVASKNIARILGVTRPSVHGMLAQMIERGFIEKARNGRARLTEEGLSVAQALEARRNKSQKYILNSCCFLFLSKLRQPVADRDNPCLNHLHSVTAPQCRESRQALRLVCSAEQLDQSACYSLNAFLNLRIHLQRIWIRFGMREEIVRSAAVRMLDRRRNIDFSGA